MRKCLLALLTGLILLSDPFISSANQLEQYEGELADIENQIDSVTERDQLINLVVQENKAAKIVRAYRIATTLNNQSIQTGQTALVGETPAVVSVGEKWIDNSTYAFGGGRNEMEISEGLFDCSSFVHWAFDQVGISLGDRTSVTTDTLKTLGDSISPDDVQPGDLVFFDTYKIDGHVGIYAGDGKFIGSQSSTGVAYEDMTTGYWKEKFNGRVRRID
ncbi:C40 family peptidase [Amphibacillus cookii]|uniref:C40 family peptidase n=1 Tax=Amphibacillus cookii TaxID=767787 RepID=UPI003B82F046|nr:cell wall-associated NlpC family hydrolase [Amphibacillus cookii]